MTNRRERENSSDLANLEDGVRKEQRSNFLEIGKLLTEILDNELYLLKGYKSFVKYIDDEPVFRFTGKHAIRLVRTYRFINSLPRGVSVPTSERQVRPLIKLGFEDARNVWLEAQRRTKEEGKPVTGELVAELVGQINVAKGQQDASNQRKMRPHTKPRRWGHDSDASHTDDEAWAGAVAEEAPRREVEDTQSAVLLLAEFERLRERVKDLPQQQRERLLMEWRDSVDDDLNGMESSYGSRSGGSGNRKRKQLAEPDTPTSYARVFNLLATESSDLVFPVRRKRSKTCRARRVWKVPPYLALEGASSWLTDIDSCEEPAVNLEYGRELYEPENNALKSPGSYDLAYLVSCGRGPKNEEQSMSLSFGVPFAAIPAK